MQRAWRPPTAPSSSSSPTCLDRAGKSEKAEQVLTKLIAEHGPSSETYGILGRVYKDRWEAARKAGKQVLARGRLDKAIDAYVKGFGSDWETPTPASTPSSSWNCASRRTLAGRSSCQWSPTA